MNLFDFFENKTILVLGGTGTIGSEIVSQILNYNPSTIRVLSNSENELWEAKIRFSNHIGKLRFLLGDIRNFERIKRAIKGTDYVFNAAAIKHVTFSEYNPMEAIDVNIHGLENVIEASLECNVKKLIHISTDKAINPTTVMGASKMIGERLCITRFLTRGTHSTIISCVRFGNVLGSRGSIIPLIKEQIKNDAVITLTDENMRRFFLSINQAVKLVLESALLANGGEIFVLKMPTIRIKDLVDVFIEEYAPRIGKDIASIKIETTGPRVGEKIHEELISPIEFSSCYETENTYIIYPLINFYHEYSLNNIEVNGTKISADENFTYSTKNAPTLKREEIRELLRYLNLI